MTISFNKKIVFCFFGVFLFVVEGVVAANNLPGASAKETETVAASKALRSICKSNGILTEEECVKNHFNRLNSNNSTANNRCLDINATYEKHNKAFDIACGLYKTSGEDCKKQIELCHKIENNEFDAVLAATTDEKIKKDIQELKDWLKESESSNTDEEESAELRDKIKKNGLYKYCPFQAAKSNAAYKKEKTENESSVKTLQDKIEAIDANIEKIKAKKSQAASDREHDLFLLSKAGKKTQETYLNDVKNVDKETKTKIKNLMDSMEKSREIIQVLEDTKQKNINRADEKEIERENVCHERALAALKEHRIARTQRILDGTNRISFAALVKQSKLSKKDRDILYKQKMQEQCLNDPSNQKRLALYKTKLLQVEAMLNKKKESELAKIEAAAAKQVKIDSEEHINKGELLEKNYENIASLKEEIGIKAKKFKRKIQLLDEKIKRQEALRREKTADLEDLDSSDIAKQHLLSKAQGKVDRIADIDNYENARIAGQKRWNFYANPNNTDCLKNAGHRRLSGAADNIR